MSWLAWLSILILYLGSWISITESCTCRKAHPQQQFCRDDFAILVRIRREFTTNDRRIYVVAIRKRYKTNDKAQEALRSRHLITPAYDSLCERSLEVGKVYAITGKIYALKAHINLCGMALEWNRLTKRQRKGLKVSYQKGCSCKISRCEPGRCKRFRTVCNWVVGPTEDCFVKEGICQKTRSDQCMWTRNKDLAKCKRYNYSPFPDGPDRSSAQ